MMRKPRAFGVERQAGARRHGSALSQEPLGGRGLLRRDLAGERRSFRRRLPGHAPYDAPLMVARGYASLSFLFTAQPNTSASFDVPPTSTISATSIPPASMPGKRSRRPFANGAEAEIPFERIAVNPEQTEVWFADAPDEGERLARKGFGDASVELDAIDPDRLRALVHEAIERHLPAKQYQILKVAERSERKLIAGLVGILKDYEP